jgi:hypothetical protein
VAFLEGYARALSSLERQTGRAMAWLREVLAPYARSADRAGGRPSRVALSFPAARSERDVSRLAQEVFALPGRIADLRRRKLAVALDEFQAIGAFDGGNVEHALRAAVQHQRVWATSSPDRSRRSWSACSAAAGRSTRPAR